MAEEVLDASAIDEFSEYELTGEFPEEDAPPSEEAPDSEPNNSEPNDSTPGETPETNDDEYFTSEVLRLKGITDPSRIKFEDESGAIVERDWNDLSDTERLNILTNQEDPERDLEEDEIGLINLLRQNNLTPQQYIQIIQQQAANTALAQYQQTQVPTYEIDSLTDDELFALDLLDKVGEENITDEELQEALEQAKSNETLFAKQIEGLRASYKNLEDQQKYNAEQAQIAQAEQQYQDFSNQVLNAIGSFNTFANQDVELSTDDKNDIANYILTRRDSGISDFYQDMQNPATATLAAFWLLRGPEVLEEMENQVKAAYQRGFTMGKSSNPAYKFTPRTPQVVVQPRPTSNSTQNDVQSAFSLGDESYLN